MIYAFNENFILPLSHDEVVHGKGSLLDKMPGDLWQKFANLRLLYGYMYGHPGKKLLFMGERDRPVARVEARREPRLAPAPVARPPGDPAAGLRPERALPSDPAFYQVDFEWQGFEWLELHDWENSVLAFLRRARDPNDSIVVVCNFTPVVRENYRIGVPTRRLLPRDPQHRLRDLRRLERRQRGGRLGPPRAARGRPVPPVAPRPAAGHRLPQDADRVVRCAAGPCRIPPHLIDGAAGSSGKSFEPQRRLRGDCLGLAPARILEECGGPGGSARRSRRSTASGRSRRRPSSCADRA